MGLAHLLHVFEAFGHVRLQLGVDFIFIPHESLDVLQVQISAGIFLKIYNKNNHQKEKNSMKSLLMLVVSAALCSYCNIDLRWDVS